MRKTKKITATLAIVAMMLTMLPMQVFAAGTDDTRIAGASRIQTAIAAADAGWTSADTAILAPSADANLVDALAAAPLAGQEDAPILLTEGNKLNAETKAELVKLGVSKVYVIGAIDAAVTAEVEAMDGVTATALKGASRYETAAKIAAELTAPAGTFIVGANATADALSVASYAAANNYAILLAGADGKLPASETAVGSKTYLVGGSTLVADVAGATRLSGANRYETNKAVVNSLSYEYSKVYVANGANNHLVDSLIASSLAAKTKSPILLTDNKTVAAAADVNAKLTADSKTIALGGTSVVSDAVKGGVKYTAPAELAVESVSAVGASKLNVTFNQAVDTTKAAITVKKGSFAVNVDTVTFADDKKSATVELVTKMTEGDYTVTVAGLTTTALSSTVSVEDETIAKIVFPSTNAVLHASDLTKVTTSYQVYNQYNEDITDDVSTIVFTAGKGTATGTAGTLELDATTEFAVDSTVAVSAIDPASNTFASTVLTVVDKAQVSDLKILSLYNEDDDTLDVDSTYGEFKLVVEAKDQYGNVITNIDAVAADTIVTSSNATVATAGVFANADINDDGVNELVLPLVDPNTNLDGSTTFTIISKTSGHKATFTVKVLAAATVDKLTLSAPAIAVAGEDVEIPFTAVDQFGNAVTDAATLNSGMTISSTLAGTAIAFEQDYVKGTAKLVLEDNRVTPTAATTVITAVTGTNKVTQMSVSLKDPAVPTVISGIDTDVVKVLAIGGTSTLDTGSVIVNDQYGREITPDYTAGNYSVSVVTSSATKVSASSATINSITSSNLAGLEKGTSTITLTLKNGVNTVANSAYSFTAKAVEKADIASYEIGEIGKVYANPVTHGVDVVVYGLLADGTKVSVPNTSDYYTATLLNSDSANNALFILTGGTLTADSTIVTDADTLETTGTLIVTVNGANGAVVLTKTVTATEAAPVVTTLSIEDGGATIVEDADNFIVSAPKANLDTAGEVNTEVTAILKAVDQYGVDIAPGATTNIITNITDGKLIVDIVAGDTFNVTVITGNGKVITIKFIAK